MVGMKPDFIIIGAQKAGTTNLWWILDQHPEIAMSRPKETHYFERYVDYPDEKWYQSLFDKMLVSGEADPEYCFWPGCLYRISLYHPVIKLIMLLREPVERAISQYWMEFNRGTEHLPIDEALVPMAARESSRNANGVFKALYHHSYLLRGIYHTQLDEVFKFFPKEHVLIVMFDQFVSNTTEVMWKIAEFLGVEPNWEYDDQTAKFASDYGYRCPPEVEQRLADYFVVPNQLLTEKHDIDIGAWT
jgi:hypothetical protein